MPIDIKTFFDTETATFTYVVSDKKTPASIIIDPVLNYDQFSGKTWTTSADEVITYIQDNSLKVEWILETHIHADHLTAASYIKKKLGGKIGVSQPIRQVLEYWVPVFNTNQDTTIDGSQFDCLFQDNAIFKLSPESELFFHVLYTPGHTPACASYWINDAVFVGDALFMPDVGTGRADFPGGNAAILYDSITRRIFSLPKETLVLTGHDYPPSGRNASSASTIKEQQEKNILINQNISKEEFISTRNKRDEGKAVPKLLFPAIQFNLRAGSFGHPESNGRCYFKMPIFV